MEIKGLPVAQAAGAILLMALSTNTLAAYESFYESFMDTSRQIQEHRLRNQELELRQQRGEMEQRLMQTEIELRQQQLELRRMEVERQRHHAEYTSQTSKPIFGVRTMPPAFYGRGSTGAYVESVVQGGPAFKANIMEGDIIIAIAGKPVNAEHELANILPNHVGQKVPVGIIRGTRTLDIDVQLSEGY